ncbi:MAG: class II fructose-1,6-bisphosphate aldolase [Planctomycetes bacterium]|nr:class II fructose-1,6-bisphosphate aldolase [Planctomycetota bacterium]MCW8135301.1 class II fructose-1,6-bisphosphate aldolase [Planctomycetota bacterium]
MPLEILGRMYEKANREYYAIGQFNFSNLEFLQAAVEAAEEMKSPVIVALSTGAIKYGGIKNLVALTRTMAEQVSVPVALHLDHGEKIDDIKRCVDAGFTSVMIDGSHHSLDENIALTRQAAEYAHGKGITVEAELGRLGGIEDDINVDERDARLTDPDEAVRFVKESGCDALAVAVGTSHGAYKFKGENRIDFDRIKTIKSRLGIPLVLHGASSVDAQSVAQINEYGGKIEGAKGLDAESYARAIKNGINKVNIDTDLRLKWTAVLRKIMHDKPGEFDPRKFLGPARDAVKEIIKEKMKLLGSAGKA